jgi:hypothetical protein
MLTKKLDRAVLVAHRELHPELAAASKSRSVAKWMSG